MRHRTREWTDCLYNQLPSFSPPSDGKDRASQHFLILLFGADAACWQDLAQTLDWESGNKAALRFCSRPLLGVVAAATERLVMRNSVDRRAGVSLRALSVWWNL